MNLTKPNPEMLTLAREARGLSQKELALATGLSQPYLSQIQGGQVPFTSDHAEKFSEVLDFPSGFFYLTEPVYGYGSSCLYHRKRASLSMVEYKRLLAYLNIVRINLTRLLADVEIEAANTFPRMDIEEFGSAALIAKILRGQWGIPPGPVKNLVEVIESAGGLIVELSFGTRRLDAISQWPPGIPPIFFVNADAPSDRKRFTVAHELGHLLMHVKPSANLEAEADEFAAEFLMPSAEIGPQLRSTLNLEKLVELKGHWRVSIAALVRRARDLGRISEDQYRRMVTKLSAMGHRLVEPCPISGELPRLVDKILRVHRNDHGLSEQALSEIAGVHPGQFALRPLEAAPPKPRPSRPDFRVVR